MQYGIGEQCNAILAELWLSFQLVKTLAPQHILLRQWSVVVPKHVSSIVGEELAIIRQAFWNCLQSDGINFFKSSAKYQSPELLAYAEKRFPRLEFHKTQGTGAQITLKEFYQAVCKYSVTDRFTVFDENIVIEMIIRNLKYYTDLLR